MLGFLFFMFALGVVIIIIASSLTFSKYGAHPPKDS